MTVYDGRTGFLINSSKPSPDPLPGKGARTHSVQTKGQRQISFVEIDSSMAGRGRGINLPHWMTAAEGAGADVPSASINEPSNPPSGQIATATMLGNAPPSQIPSVQPIISYGNAPLTATMPGNIPPGLFPGSTPMMPYGLPVNAGPMPGSAPMMPYGLPGNLPPGVMMPSFPRPLPFMGGMPRPMPMSMQMQSGVMPGGQVPMMMSSMMPRPMVPPGSSNSGSNKDIDPNTEIINWSEHVMPDGRKYWYNKVTNLSTYDKPLVLKTPEERSIPPCKWKEYVTNDGKKYYSDGVESKWEPPEEYIVWKEKIDAIESKKKSSMSMAAVDPVTVTPMVAPTYDSKDEAINAFKELLNDKKVTVTMKIAQVQDLCQSDVRWLALPNQGERKQALAEYQSKRQKQEKELVAIKFKKSKDAFLMMLAENTDIDAHTRWREACEVLCNDRRFKDIDDPRDREDIYNDFIAELVKKERMDREKERGNALGKLSKIMLEMYNSGRIRLKMTFQECKSQIVGSMSSSELKAIDENDIKRNFFEYLDKIEQEMKEEEKRQREIFMQTVRDKSAFLRSLLLPLVDKGQINAESRWRDVQEMLMPNPSYQNLRQYYDIHREALEGFGMELTPGKDTFDEIINDIRDVYRNDKRAVKETLHELKLVVKHNMTLDQFKTVIYRAIGLQPPIVEEINENTAVDTAAADAEEGEEVEELRTVKVPERVHPTGAPLHASSHIKAIINQRVFNIDMIYNDLIVQAKRDHEEDERKHRRKTERFIDLLSNTFGSKDHLNLSFEEGMKRIETHNAYEALDSKDRRHLYTTYMSKLALKYNMEVKRGENMTVQEDAAFVGPEHPPVIEIQGKRKRKDSVGSEASTEAASSKRKSSRGKK